MRKAAATVSVGTYSAWETTATLRLLGGARGLGRPRGRRGAGHIVSPRAQLVSYEVKNNTKTKMKFAIHFSLFSVP